MKKKCKKCGTHHGGAFSIKGIQEINGMFRDFLIKSANVIYNGVNKEAKKSIEEDNLFQNLNNAHDNYNDFRYWENGVKDLEDFMFKYVNEY